MRKKKHYLRRFLIFLGVLAAVGVFLSSSVFAVKTIQVEGCLLYTSGKRFFKMAPLHHHFEMCGMKEKHVVAMFWLAALVCCAIAYGIMSL